MTPPDFKQPPSTSTDSSNNQQWEIEIAPHRSQLIDVRAFVAQCLEQSSFSERDQRLIRLAVDEAVASVTESADCQAADPIRLIISLNDVCFKCVISDAHNDYLISEDSDLQLWRVEQSRVTLGIFLIRQIMDEVKYVYRRGFENALELIKFH